MYISKHACTHVHMKVIRISTVVNNKGSLHMAMTILNYPPLLAVARTQPLSTNLVDFTVICICVEFYPEL